MCCLAEDVSSFSFPSFPLPPEEEEGPSTYSNLGACIQNMQLFVRSALHALQVLDVDRRLSLVVFAALRRVLAHQGGLRCVWAQARAPQVPVSRHDDDIDW